jgi:aspartate racemase
MPAITLVKQGRIHESVPLADNAFFKLSARGAEAIILGCTELPLAFEQSQVRKSIPVVDPTDALAADAVQWQSALSSSAADGV